MLHTKYTHPTVKCNPSAGWEQGCGVSISSCLAGLESPRCYHDKTEFKAILGKHRESKYLCSLYSKYVYLVIEYLYLKE